MSESFEKSWYMVHMFDLVLYQEKDVKVLASSKEEAYKLAKEEHNSFTVRDITFIGPYHQEYL